MTGEMYRADVTPEAFPLHFAIARALGGSVEPFDVYVSTRREVWAETIEEASHTVRERVTRFKRCAKVNGGNAVPLPPEKVFQDKRPALMRAVIEAARKLLEHAWSYDDADEVSVAPADFEALEQALANLEKTP